MKKVTKVGKSHAGILHVAMSPLWLAVVILVGLLAWSVFTPSQSAKKEPPVPTKTIVVAPKAGESLVNTAADEALKVARPYGPVTLTSKFDISFKK